MWAATLLSLLSIVYGEGLNLIDSLDIPPVGTEEQIQWQLNDVGCFIHYNMATMAGSQGCNCDKQPPDISLWNPSHLDTDSWIQNGIAMGCKRFVYVAKHMCGFISWNSSVQNYPYTVAHSRLPQVDVVASFVASARKFGVGYGFYYSTVANAFVRVCDSLVQNDSLYTQDQYNTIVLQHLRELWGNYGSLAEVWFDGGYNTNLTTQLRALFNELQPKVVAFQGEGLSLNPVRWVGSESGLVPYPCWSTCSYNSSGSGDPSSSQWFPAETDFTLLKDDTWFYDPHKSVRSPSELRLMYENASGTNTALIIDFAPFPNGTLPQAQQDAAQALGAYVKGCYDTPLLRTNGSDMKVLYLKSDQPVTVNRVVLREDQHNGQLVRQFSLRADGQSVAQGTSIGNKFILRLASPLSFKELELSIDEIAIASPSGAPFLSDFAVFNCATLEQDIDAEWFAKHPDSPENVPQTQTGHSGVKRPWALPRRT